MLKLAELLALHNLHITFLNTEQTHNRLIRFNDIEALSVCYPKLQFKTIPEFYSKRDIDKHPGIGERVVNLIESMDLYAKPHLRNVLVSAGVPKISCIIADGLFGNLTTDLAAEFGILNIHFRTLSACCFWAHLCVPNLFHSNELPITAVATDAPVMASITIESALLLLAADITAPVMAPPITAFCCSKLKEKGRTMITQSSLRPNTTRRQVMAIVMVTLESGSKLWRNKRADHEGGREGLCGSGCREGVTEEGRERWNNKKNLIRRWNDEIERERRGKLLVEREAEKKEESI